MKSRKQAKFKAPEALRILVVVPDLVVSDPDDEHAKSQAERSRALRIGLLENGFNLIASLPGDVFLADRINQLQPDLIIVDAESEARDALEHVVFATRDARRPIVMFTDDSDTSHVKDAVAVGVSAYIVRWLGQFAHQTNFGSGNGPLRIRRATQVRARPSPKRPARPNRD